MRILLTICAAAAVLSGCGSLSGLDAENNFACKAPDGVTCQSVSGLYANSMQNNLPALRTKHDAGGAPQEKASSPGKVSRPGLPYQYQGEGAMPAVMQGMGDKVSPQAMATPYSGMPLRTHERILRVWLAPFEDQDGDLHDQKYFYVTVQTGSWTVEANKIRIREKFQQIFPLSRSQKQDDEPKTQGGNGVVMPSMSQQQQNLPVMPTQSFGLGDNE